MKTIKVSEVMKDSVLVEEVLETIRKGNIIIYPIDTVYGIGCNIGNADSVKKIIETKQRDAKKPLSIIAPSIGWIEENCIVTDFNKNFMEKLFPGPYTVVLKVKKDGKIPNHIISQEHTIGVRIPRNSFTDIIRSSGIPVISTSVNISGQESATKIEDIPEAIKNIASIAIDSGQLSSSSSRVFDLTTDEVKILRW